MLAEDEGSSIVRSEVGALEAISRSEVAMQLDSAHRWPRSPTKCLKDATSLATMSVEIAESCMYSVPRGGKMITGPSVRLAEMMASSWGNLHVGARVIEATATEVVAQSVCWDLEKNVRVTVEAQRSIVGKKGRFDDDMIRVTGMAAISIALRNAVFRVIPRAYVDAVYEIAKQCAVGDLQTLVARRDGAFARYAKLGVTPERMLARLGIAGVDDFTLMHLETLVGMYTSIKSGELSLDDAFPAVGPAPSLVPAGTPEGKRISLKPKTKGAAAPAANTEAPPKPSAAPAPAAAPAEPVDLVELHEALADVDIEAWSAPGCSAVIAAWTVDQQREALTWAVAVRDDGPMEIQAKRPRHTLMAAG